MAEEREREQVAQARSEARWRAIIKRSFYSWDAWV